MKRVECDKCEHFIPSVYEDDMNLLSKPLIKAKCELGKRIMFRMPIFLHYFSYAPIYDGGYIRYCNDFIKLSDVTSNI